jgi:hypothetical protein
MSNVAGQATSVTPPNNDEPASSGSNENSHPPLNEQLIIGERFDKFVWPTRVPDKCAKAGTESKLHKQWRKNIVKSMNGIPQSDCGPKNGKSYSFGVDYTVKGSSGHQEKILPKLLGHYQAKVIQWIRSFSMRTQFFDHTFRCGAYEAATKVWTKPLMIALELHDWEWLNILLARGAIPNDTRYQLLGPERGGSILSLCADWELSLLQVMMKPWNLRTTIEAKAAITSALKDVITSLTIQEGYKGRYAMDMDENNRLHAYAVELLVSTGPPLDVDELDGTLRKAIQIGSTALVEVLVRYNTDLAYGSEGESGTPLHQAVGLEKWDIVKLLVGAGADPSLKAKQIDRYTTGIMSRPKKLTSIELAANNGQLGKLNAVLGTKYKDTRAFSVKFTNKMNLLKN